MTATLSPSRVEPQARIVLEDVSWETYDRLVQDLAEQHVHVTYDCGRMELMSPLPEHERWKKLIGGLIEILSYELGTRIASFGSTTFRRRDLKKGLEPDECYYVQHAAAMRDKKRLDLKTDPPPDLVVEIDLTHQAIDREAIYAAMGVPEIWRFRPGERLDFLRLHQKGGYEPMEHSIAFPFLAPADLEQFLKLWPGMDDLDIRYRLRDWLRETGKLR